MRLLALIGLAAVAISGCRTTERTISGRVTDDGMGVPGARVWQELGECEDSPDDAATTDDDGRYSFVVRDRVPPVFIRAFAEAWFLDAYCVRVGDLNYRPMGLMVFDGTTGSVVDCEIGEVDGQPVCERVSRAR